MISCTAQRRSSIVRSGRGKKVEAAPTGNTTGNFSSNISDQITDVRTQRIKVEYVESQGMVRTGSHRYFPAQDATAKKRTRRRSSLGNTNANRKSHGGKNKRSVFSTLTTNDMPKEDDSFRSPVHRSINFEEQSTLLPALPDIRTGFPAARALSPGSPRWNSSPDSSPNYSKNTKVAFEKEGKVVDNLLQ